MRVRQFASELTGGTGVASTRLHRELLREGIDSWLHHRFGSAHSGHVIKDNSHSSWPWQLVQRYVIGRRWRQQNPDRGIFLHSRWIYQTQLGQFGPLPDILNLHLVFRWLDLPAFLSSIPARLPVVWSLHDLHAATGGCIHPLECDHFTTQCHDCPSLKHKGPKDQSWREYKRKESLYSRLNLHIVGNSTWTTALAQRSGLMRHAKSFHTIPLGLDIEAYRPIEKRCARQALGISPDRFVVGFACADFSDQNKGGAVLVEALASLATKAKVTLLAFGGGQLPDSGDQYQITSFGSINSPQLQSVIYSACDVFATPSRIESFGLTALESLACGTPVIAFRTGGLVDVVEDGKTGLLGEEVGSSAELSKILTWMLQHPAERQGMSIAARERVERQFSITLMAKRYIELYRSLTSASSN